jgi:hypothetical protein
LVPWQPRCFWNTHKHWLFAGLSSNSESIVIGGIVGLVLEHRELYPPATQPLFDMSKATPIQGLPAGAVVTPIAPSSDVLANAYADSVAGRPASTDSQGSDMLANAFADSVAGRPPMAAPAPPNAKPLDLSEFGGTIVASPSATPPSAWDGDYLIMAGVGSLVGMFIGFALWALYRVVRFGVTG